VTHREQGALNRKASGKKGEEGKNKTSRKIAQEGKREVGKPNSGVRSTAPIWPRKKKQTIRITTFHHPGGRERE